MKTLFFLLLLMGGLTQAQTIQTTPNLITSGSTHTWTGVTTGAIPSGCATAGPCPGGPSPIYDPSTNTISFSYNSNAYVGQTIAINNALANVGAGVKINGYNYGYEVRNMNGDNRQGGIDTFTVGTALRGPANSVLLSHNQYFNSKFDWTAYSGTKTATTPYDLDQVSYLQIGITGGDNGYWGGYFGPEIRNVSMSLKYSVDPCATNPAYSPTCANYNTVTTTDVFSGVSGPQAYAINQALSGSGVMVHGFNYGYNYSVGNRYCNWMDIFGACLGTWIYPSASVNTNITDNGGATIWNETNNHTAGTNGTYTKQLRFGASRPIASMGTFSMTPSTNNGSVVNNMYSSVVYTPDPCVVNPLSSTSCAGYQQAYTELQCSSNPLYSTTCVGYAQAYFTQQCTVNALYDLSCPGYAAAYLTYQCSINPLYSSTCIGYEQAYFNQQCSISPLYSQSCDGYSSAYHDQQCSLNPLYAVTCTEYNQAYAIKYVVKPTQTEVTNVNTISTNDVANNTVAVISDPVVNQTITPTTSVSPATTATTVVPLVSTPSTGTSNVTTTSVSTSTTVAAAPTETKPSAPTARQELQAKRQAAAKAAAIEKGKNLANEMGKTADMESQKQIQNVVIQAMGFTPGFDSYGKAMVPDAQGYKPFTVYNKQINVDNARLGRRMYGPSDALHTEMVEMQWEIK